MWPSKNTRATYAEYSLFEEIRRAIRLNHPNLVRYYDAFELNEQTPFGDKIQVGVLEYVNGGDLLRFMRQQPAEPIIKEVVIGVMSGLQYLHSCGIIHRDMKPENILLQQEGDRLIPKIADFGISKVLSESGSGNSSLVIGSIEYMAPEQFNLGRYGNNGQQHTNLDLWSLGVIIYELFHGQPPFGRTAQGIPRDEIMRNILEHPLDDFGPIPEPFRQIAQRCLVRSAAQRAQSVDELFDILYRYGMVIQPGSGTTIMLPQKIDVSKMETEPIRRPSGIVQPTPVDPPVEPVKKVMPPPVEQPKVSRTQSAFTQSLAWQPVWLLPLVSAAVAYYVYENRVDIFGKGTPISTLYLFPALLAVSLLVVNAIVSWSRREQSVGLSFFLLAFFTLPYYAIKALLAYDYAQQKIRYTQLKLELGAGYRVRRFPILLSHCHPCFVSCLYALARS